jgi:hypothetical protein
MISQVLTCFDTDLILSIAKCVGTFEHLAMESFDLGARSHTIPLSARVLLQGSVTYRHPYAKITRKVALNFH